MSTQYRYNSLEDYLTSSRLDINGILDDGWGTKFPVKGREIYAVILFCDIANFSGRTYDLSPVETLIYVNNFFAWISSEALQGRPAIIDKYIGDEIMVLFSKEFGSSDPFVDAINTARFMAEHDVFCYGPHIGISAGNVVVGYVGTPLKYSCSVFGRPVAIAARCASVKCDECISSSITLPAELWAGRDITKLFEPIKINKPDGSFHKQEMMWRTLAPRVVPLKNMPDLEIQEIVNDVVHLSTTSAEQRAVYSAKALMDEGSYKIHRYEYEEDLLNDQ